MQTFCTASWMLSLFIKGWCRVGFLLVKGCTHTLIGPSIGSLVGVLGFFSFMFPFFSSPFISSFPLPLSLSLIFLPFIIFSFTLACLKITTLPRMTLPCDPPASNSLILGLQASTRPVYGALGFEPTTLPMLCFLSSKYGFIQLIVTVEPILLSV